MSLTSHSLAACIRAGSSLLCSVFARGWSPSWHSLLCLTQPWASCVKTGVWVHAVRYCCITLILTTAHHTLGLGRPNPSPSVWVSPLCSLRSKFEHEHTPLCQGMHLQTVGAGYQKTIFTESAPVLMLILILRHKNILKSFKTVSSWTGTQSFF